MIAEVAPRFRSPITGESLLLSDYVQELLAKRKPTIVRLHGEGKTTALRHLAAKFQDWQGVERELELEDETISMSDSDPIVIVRISTASRADVELRLSPWTRDDFIEYLLAAHPHQCKAVMLRLQHANLNFAGGSPEIWRMILDRMALEPLKQDVPQLVLAELINLIPRYEDVGLLADEMLKGSEQKTELPSLLSQQQLAVQRLLRNRDVRNLFLTRRFYERIESGDLESLLNNKYDRDFLLQVSAGLRRNRDGVFKLEHCFSALPEIASANCATLLRHANPGWRPTGKALYLSGACLDGAFWPDIQLERADLRGTSLVEAVLTGARLISARIGGADFSDANLTNANLSLIGQKRPRGFFEKREKQKDTRQAQPGEPTRASLVRANLTNAKLANCLFRSTDFSHAVMQKVIADASHFLFCNFSLADLTDASFVSARLFDVVWSDVKFDRCSFYEAVFERVNFENKVAISVDFRNVDFNGCLMNGSSFRRTTFAGAILADCRMAEIDWEQCDLKRADLRGCTFHLGSSRSGLVDSPYPGHGSKTGSYTDEFGEQYFKTPEMIRKANLCGADLRGAKIDGVDFYLVDLREAKFDAGQLDQLVSTGAILSDEAFGG
jgi:uncharacterized protein YjbI with pentapeptide repeats